MAYFDEGSANFTYRTADLVVDETPLYELARRGPDGAPLSLGAPRVMGSGPPFARRPADAPGGRPRFGAYSRIYFAVAPATAAAFDPDASPDAVALLTAQGSIPRPIVAASRERGQGRRRDVACFAATDFPASCTWLDSQARIEDSLGVVNIVRHERHGLLAAGVLRGQGDRRTMSRAALAATRALTLLLAALAAAGATPSGQARADTERGAGRAAGPARAREPASSPDAEEPAETEAEGFVLPAGTEVAPPLSLMGYVDFGFADAGGNGTSFRPVTTACPPTTASTPSPPPSTRAATSRRSTRAAG